MSEKVYRTAIYARLSREDGDKAESNSISSQRTMCEEYISKHKDLELVETFVDDGYSGVDFNRPDFRRMDEAVRENRIEAIVCKDLSRFSRNYIESGRYLQQIYPALGIRFIAINDSYDSLTGDLASDSYILPFKNLINDTYCKDISVKIRSSLDVKRRNGLYVGSYTPYGYKKNPEDKNRIIVDSEAAEVVRRIFSMYKDGMSVCRIADWLNELGVLSPMEYKLSKGIKIKSPFRTGSCAKWSYRAVKRILTNETYIGVMVQGKRSTPNYKVHVLQDREESEWIRVEGTHEALVTYDDFMSVKEMLGRDMRTSGEDTDDNVFSGFIYCADCGQPMTRKVIPSGGKKYYYYVCSTNKRHEGCKSHSISVRKVESITMKAVQDQISNVLNMSDTMEYIEQLPSKDLKVVDYDALIVRLEEEISRCRRMKLRIYEDLTDGVITKKEYTSFRNQYTARLEEKEAALEHIRREKRDASASGGDERAWVTLFKQYENVNELTRRVLMALVDKIYVYEGHKIEVSFKYGDEFRRIEDIIEKNAELLPDRKEA